MGEAGRRKSHELQCMQCRVCGIGHFLKHRHESNVSKHSPVREKSTVLLNVSDSPAQQHSGLCANVFVAHEDLTALRLDESVEAAE
jgi:hypothetical protein